MASISDYLNECELDDVLQELQKQSYDEEPSVQVNGGNKINAIDCVNEISGADAVDILESSCDDVQSSSSLTNNTTGIEEHEESRENVLTDWYLSEETYNVPSDEPLRAGERKESSNNLINLSKDMGESKPSDTPDVNKREAELTTCDAGNVSNEQSLFSSGDENQDYDVSDNKYLRPGDIIEYRPQSVNHCDLRDNLVLATVTEIIMDEDEVEVKLDDFTTLYGFHGLRRVAKMCNDGKIMMDKSRWHFVNEFNLGCTSLFPSYVPPRKKLFMQNTVNNSLFQFRKSATEFCESYGIPNDIITVRDTVTDQNGDNNNGTPIIKSSTRRSKRTKK
jgi:hypothetical protein